MIVDGRAGVELPAGVWFAEPVREMTIFAEQYDFAVTLLLLENRDSYMQLDREPEESAAPHLSFDSIVSIASLSSVLTLAVVRWLTASGLRPAPAGRGSPFLNLFGGLGLLIAHGSLCVLCLF
jgi:hypothetical protein